MYQEMINVTKTKNYKGGYRMMGETILSKDVRGSFYGEKISVQRPNEVKERVMSRTEGSVSGGEKSCFFCFLFFLNI